MVTKRIIPFFLLGLVVLSEPLLSGPPPFCYEEQDGSPAGCFKKLKFPNGNVTDNGDGSFSIADNTSVGGGNSVYLEEGDVAKLNNSSADLTLDFNGTDFDTSVAGAELDLTIAAGVTRDTEWDTEAEVQTAWGSVDILLKTEGDSYYQPLEATLTDIADGTIVEDLVNTANPWADNEVADTITASNYLPLAGGTLTGEVVVDDLGLEFTAGDALSDCSSFSATGGGIFYDDSEGKFKKCQDNTLTDLDTGGAGTIDGSGTTNEITYWVDADTLGSLAVATYPSLTELSYVKGVTSAIQTQINGKLASADIDTYSELNAIVADVTLTHNGLIDTYSELNAIVADQTLTHNGLIDTFAELDAIVADKALLNKADGGVITGSWDMGGASVEIPNSTSLPGTCTVGQIYMDTDATTGQRIYACESTNTWALQGDGGGGGGDEVSINSVAVTNPDFVSTGQVSFTDTSNTITANVTNDSLLEVDLKAVDSASDEDILTYESTTGDFEWHTISEMIALMSQGALPNDSVVEADLKAVDSPNDEECLTYETTTGDFEWQSCGSGGGGAKIIQLNPYSAKITGAFVTASISGLDTATQGAQIDAGDGNWRVLFDATTDEAIVFYAIVPDNYTSTPVVNLLYSLTSATTLEVEWEAALMCVSPGDSADVGTASFAAGATGGGETVPGTAGYIDTLESITPTDDSCAAGDLMYVYVSTDADDATNDDATGDRELVGAYVSYT